MKYYFNLFMLCCLTTIVITGSTILYASLYDPHAEDLVKLFVNCIVKILLLGN